MTAAQLLDRVDACDLRAERPRGLGWIQAYCDNVTDRGPLVQRIALAAYPNSATIRTIRKSPSAC